LYVDFSLLADGKEAMDMATRALTEQVKVGLAAGAMLAVGVGFVLARLREKAKDNEVALEYIKNTIVFTLGQWKFNLYQSFAAILIVFAAFSTINYSRFSTATVFVDSDGYDLMHYYLNSKYFDELGYFRLLPSVINADNQAGEWCPGQAPVYLAQDENEESKKSHAYALSLEKEIKSHFTPERWKEFVHDSMYILRQKQFGMDCGLWRMLLQDHGFNGTPVWVFMARPFTSIIPVESIKVAAWLDVVWIVAALWAVFWAFGLETMAFSWLFIGLCYSFRWPHIPWAFLRYDWISCLVLSICMVKKEKYAWGGAFIGYAALMRYFPALWLIFIFGKAVHSLFTNKSVSLGRFWMRVPMHYYRMAFGFFLTIILLMGASVARDGISAHKASLANMAEHVLPENLSSRRQGLAITLTYRGEDNLNLITKEKKDIVQRIEKPLRAVCLILLVAFGLFVSRRPDWEVIGLAFIPYFMLTTSSYYYYVIRLTGVVIHAADLSKPRNAVGLAILFFIELVTNGIEQMAAGNRYLLVVWMGIMLIFYAVVIFGWYGYDWWKEHKAELAAAPAPAPIKKKK
jgi:hypothetical protein